MCGGTKEIAFFDCSTTQTNHRPLALHIVMVLSNCRTRAGQADTGLSIDAQLPKVPLFDLERPDEQRHP